MLEKWMLKGERVVLYNDCFEAVTYGNAERSVCHLVEGYLEGFLCELFNKEITLTEVKCQAMGDAYCEHLIANIQVNGT